MKNLVFGLVAFMALQSEAQPIFSSKGAAIRGYDMVGYFTEDKAVKGKKKFSYTWHDAEWRFKDSVNLEKFKMSPESYAPQFGGYCAYGVSENHKSPTDPNAFTVLNGKLYLNYSMMVRQLWYKDRDDHIQKAEKNWPELKNKD